MATNGNELDRAAARAAREATRAARAEVDRQVKQLLTDVQALIDALREVADAKVSLLRSRVANAVAATKAAWSTRAQHALEQSDRYVHATVATGGRRRNKWIDRRPLHGGWIASLRPAR